MSLDKDNKLICTPKIITKGFAENPNSHVVRHSLMRANEVLDAMYSNTFPVSDLKKNIKANVSKYIERTTGRRPMVIPMILNEDM